MATALRTGATAFAVSLCCASTATATVVSGSITDAAGDGRTPNGVHPYDLATYGIEYDDQGVVTASVSFHDKEDGNVHVFPWFVSASVGFWNVPGRNAT
jgi:hypothetical protein